MTEQGRHRALPAPRVNKYVQFGQAVVDVLMTCLVTKGKTFYLIFDVILSTCILYG